MESNIAQSGHALTQSTWCFLTVGDKRRLGGNRKEGTSDSPLIFHGYEERKPEGNRKDGLSEGVEWVGDGNQEIRDLRDPGADDSDRTESDSAGPQSESSSAPYTDAEEDTGDQEDDYLENQYQDYDDDDEINFRGGSDSESEASWPVDTRVERT